MGENNETWEGEATCRTVRVNVDADQGVWLFASIIGKTH